MGTRGPKPVEINWDEFDKLVSYQCTQREIAAFFDVSVDTLERACERDLGMKLADIWDKRVLMGRIRLRKAQLRIAESMGPGAATMAIWLGKVMLGQTDKPPEPPKPEYSLVNQKGQKSFRQFCLDAGYPGPFEKQEEMRAFGFDETETRMLLGARGYGKSDYVTVLGIAYDIYINGTKTTNLIISKSKVRNSAMIEEIANALEANGVKLSKRNSTCVRIEGLIGKDHSVEAVTIKTSLRSRHPKRIIMDDPVTEEDVSPAQRRVVKRKYDEAYKLCENILIIGQPAHADDLYALLRDKLKLMLVPHGTIPRLDADLVAMEKAGVDKNSIEMSYHLRVPKDGAMIFSGIKFIDKLPFGETVAFIDPSDGGDFTAISIFRGHFDSMAVYGKVWKKAWYHCMDEIVETLTANMVTRLAFETNSTGEQPIEQLQELFGELNLNIGVVGKFSTTNKHSTIVVAGSYGHMIQLSKESDQAYLDQVTKYEYGAENDDAPDSLARGMEWLGLIKGKKTGGKQ